MSATAISVAALALSVLTAGVSAFFAIRQTRLSLNANHIPTMATVMAEFRSSKFHDDHATVLNLASPIEPQGFSTLPEEERSAFINVVYFYQMLSAQMAGAICGSGRQYPKKPQRRMHTPKPAARCRYPYNLRHALLRQLATALGASRLEAPDAAESLPTAGHTTTQSLQIVCTR